MNDNHTVFRSYEENLRQVSMEYPETWILINVNTRRSLSMNDEERIMNRWVLDTSWTHLAHDGVLYERK